MTRSRLAAVDALRGLALFGMLAVHVQYYAEGPPIWGDRIETWIDALFTHRFYALFAFLFGVGFALQIERWGDKPGFVRMYLRRLLVLALFAVVIAALTGYRVLLGYAFWGLALLLMRRWSQRALLVAAVVISLSHPAVSTVHWQIEKRTIGVEASNKRVAAERDIWRARNREENRINKERTFPQLMKQRVRVELRAFVRPTWYIPGSSLLMFVFGLFAVRRGLLGNPSAHRTLLIAIVVLGVLLAQVEEFIHIKRLIQGEPLRRQDARLLLMEAVFNWRFQGLAYGAALLLWISYAREFPRLCSWLAYAGRMSLTNYVVQVCVLELVFSGFGLTITCPVGLVLTVLFFVAQVLYSKWWFTRYRIGPLEWVWRSLTYGQRQALRAAPPAPVAV